MKPVSTRYCFSAGSPQRQRGVASIMTGIFILFVALGSAALVIDTGRLYMEHRSLQRIADSIALDTAHQSALCGAGELNTDNLQPIAEANGFAGDFGDAGNEVLLGRLEDDDGRWQFVPDSDNSEAVFVQVSRSVPASMFLGGIIDLDELSLRKQAVAKREPAASISVGSGLLGVDPGILNDVLGDLLGTDVELDAVSYEGLADAGISLADLVEADGSVGTADELLDTSMSLAEMLELFATAADNEGVASATLNGLLEGSGSIREVQLELMDILGVESPAPAAGLEAELGLLDLITAAAIFANRENALTMPLDLDLGVPGLIDAETVLELYIVEAPQIAVGPPGQDADGNWRTEARTAQVRVSSITEAETTIGVAGIGLVDATITLGLAAEAAQGSARLVDMECGTYAQQNFRSNIHGRAGLADLYLGYFSGPDMTELEDSTIELNSPLLDGDVTLSSDARTMPASGFVSTPICRDDFCHVNQLPEPPDEPHRVGSDFSAELASLANGLEVEAELCILPAIPVLPCVPVNINTQLLENLIGDLIVELGSLLVPLFDTLGINVGYADITLLDAELERVELVR